MQTEVDVYDVIVIGVDRPPNNDLEKARFDTERHGCFGSNPGDDELERTIYSDGVKQPPAVRKVNGKLEILDGARRTLALRSVNDLKRKLGEPEFKLPVIVLDCVSDLEASITQVELNLNRNEDDPISLGEKFKVIVESMVFDKSHPMPHTEACGKLGSRVKCSASKVIQYIKLTNLSPDVQDQVRKGTLGIAVAVSLVNLAPQTQSETMNKLLDKGKGKSAEEARKIRAEVTNKPLVKPPSIPRETWKDVFFVVDNDPTLKHLDPKITAIRIALGEIPIGHDPEIMSLVERVSVKKEKV